MSTLVDCKNDQDSSYPYREAPLQGDFAFPHIFKVKFISPYFESRLGHVACFGHVTQEEAEKWICIGVCPLLLAFGILRPP